MLIVLAGQTGLYVQLASIGPWRMHYCCSEDKLFNEKISTINK
jgi:hypothetical protein